MIFKLRTKAAPNKTEATVNNNDVSSMTTTRKEMTSTIGAMTIKVVLIYDGKKISTDRVNNI